MFAPAAKTIVPVLVAPAVPNADTTFALAAVVAEIVIVLAFIPTDTIPAPEMFSALETANDVDAAPRVFPRAVTERDDV